MGLFAGCGVCGAALGARTGGRERECGSRKKKRKRMASSTPEPRPAHAADAREAPQHGDAAPQEHEVSDGSVAKASAASLPQKNVAKQPRKRPAPKTLAPLTEKIGAYYGVKPAWEVAEMFGVSAA